MSRIEWKFILKVIKSLTHIQGTYSNRDIQTIKLSRTFELKTVKFNSPSDRIQVFDLAPSVELALTARSYAFVHLVIMSSKRT